VVNALIVEFKFLFINIFDMADHTTEESVVISIDTTVKKKGNATAYVSKGEIKNDYRTGERTS